MNKSKFLKKSLAMVLAVMMIVAMIPLGASAAPLPNFTAIDINNVATVVEGNTFKADIPATSTTVKVAATVRQGATLVARGTERDYDIVNVNATPPTLTTNSVTLNLVDFDANYATKEEITIPLVLSNTTGGGTKLFNIVLTKTYKKTTTDLASVTLYKQNDSNAVYSIGDAVINNTTKSVKLRVPRGLPMTGIYDVAYATKENATINGTTTGTIGDVDFAAGKDQKDILVVSESGGNTANFDIELEYVDILSSFAVDGIEGTIAYDVDGDGNPNSNTITVYLPDTYVRDKDGKKLAADTAVNLPVTYTKAYGNAVVKLDTVAFTSGNKIDFGTNKLTHNPVAAYTATLTTEYLGVPCDYAVTVDLVKSNDTTIYAATLDDEAAKIDVAKATITAELAKGKNLTAVSGISFTVNEDAADVEVIAQNTKVTGSLALPADGRRVWTPDAAVDVTGGLIVTVTAGDGTMKAYKVTATNTAVVTLPEYGTITLKDPAGNDYVMTRGTTDTTSNTYTVTVPYMTMDMSGWKFFFTGNTTNTYFVQLDPASGDPRTGTIGAITASDVKSGMAIGSNAILPNGNPAKAIPTTGITGMVGAISKSDPTQALHKFNLVIKLKDPVVVRTDEVKLNGVKATYASAASAVTNTNTKTAALDSAKNEYKVTIPDTPKDTYLTAATTTNSGVLLFKANAGDNYKLTTLTTDKDLGTHLTTTGQQEGTFIVMPERYARAALVDATDGASPIATAKYDMVPTGTATGNIYKYTVGHYAPSKEAKIRGTSLKFGEVTPALNTIENQLDSYIVVGRLNYSMTIGSTAEATAATAIFPEFVMRDEYASLNKGYNAGVGVTPFVSLGAKDDDGNAEAISATNPALQFVRRADGGVDVYVTTAANGSITAKTDDTHPGDWVNSLIGVAEDPLNKATYYFVDPNKNTCTLTYAKPNTYAQITSFKVAGVNGKINGTTITVDAPLGTKVSALVPTFTASTGATVSYSGNVIKSGETVIDFTNPVVFEVLSEDGLHKVPYTIKVTAAAKFVDVPEGSWYYNAVMTAYNNGWISGTGEGKFSPEANLKRGDFALIIAKAMDAELTSTDYTEGTSFPDVPEGKYYTAAINWCASENIMNGDGSTGKFNPEATITREEMARVICSAKKLDKVTNPAKTFKDDAKIANWAKGFVYACNAAGIINGDEKGNFNPKQPTKRNEGAQVLYKAFA